LGLLVDVLTFVSLKLLDDGTIENPSDSPVVDFSMSKAKGMLDENVMTDVPMATTLMEHPFVDMTSLSFVANSLEP